MCKNEKKSISKRVAMSQGKSEGKNKGGAGKANYDARGDGPIDTFKDSWCPSRWPYPTSECYSLHSPSRSLFSKPLPMPLGSKLTQQATHTSSRQPPNPTSFSWSSSFSPSLSTHSHSRQRCFPSMVMRKGRHVRNAIQNVESDGVVGGKR